MPLDPASGPKALWKGSGARSPSVPLFSRARSMTEDNLPNRVPGVGTAHPLFFC